MSNPPPAKRQKTGKVVVDTTVVEKLRADSAGLVNVAEVRKLTTKEACYEEPHFDEAGAQLEESGELQFEMVRNDGSHRSNFILFALKHAINKQLPEMGAGYILRILYDPRHLTIVAKFRDIVIGGITFRPFYTPECNFGEIVFCVVYRGFDKTKNLKGVGARMMNRLKHECLHSLNPRVTRFLTYADDTAIGFFSRLGFTKQITLAHDVWKGRIKDYVKATLMECVIREGIDYRAITDIVHLQRQYLLNVWPKMTAPSKTFGDSRRVAVAAEIPGLSEASKKRIVSARFSSSIEGSGDKETILERRVQLHFYLQRIFDALVQHDKAFPFHQSVDEIIQLYEGYGEKIRLPMDLNIIRNRLKSGDYYRSFYMFLADVIVMLYNCMLFNGKGHAFYDDSEYLIRWLGDQCNRVQTQSTWMAREAFDKVKESALAAYERDVAKWTT
eukprot:ANDGO_08206.mRNA.1 Histone acetyltransferase GCN5